jgi:nitrate/TMAO reductase-like tetraheme cytochrome c subunit
MGKIKEWIKTNVVITVIIAIVVVYGIKASIDFSSAPAFCKMTCHDMEQDVVSFRASFHGGKLNNGKPVSHNGHKADCHACHYDPGLVGLMIGKMEAMLSIVHEVTGEKGEPVEEFRLSKEGEERIKNWVDKKEWDAYVSEPSKGEHAVFILPQYIHKPKKGPVYVAALHGKKRRVTNDACKRCHPDKTGMVNANALLDAQKDVEKDPNALAPESKAEAKSKAVAMEEKFSAVPGPHASHEDKGLICLDCHQEIAHAPVDLGISPMNLPRMEICFRCHNGEKAFKDACAKCHTGQVNMHAGKGAKDVEDAPGLMNGQAECGDCGHSEGNKFKADVSTCDGCHSAGYKDMVKDWQASYEASVAPVKVLIEEVEKLLKKSGKKQSSEMAEAEELFNIAKYNYDYAVKDGSRGAHNNDYTDAMLKKAAEKLKAAKELLPKK